MADAFNCAETLTVVLSVNAKKDSIQLKKMDMWVVQVSRMNNEFL